MKRTFAILAVLAAITIGAVSALNTRFASSTVGETSQVSANEQTITLAVENMFCELCPVTVKTAMERVAGVSEVSVSYEAQTAIVIYDPTIATPEMIAAASTNIGYPAHPTEG
ncbi:MAG: heavy metal-associated domain-containing protein [Gammaproteobacteria bacterium]